MLFLIEYGKGRRISKPSDMSRTKMMRSYNVSCQGTQGNVSITQESKQGITLFNYRLWYCPLSNIKQQSVLCKWHERLHNGRILCVSVSTPIITT